MDKKDMSPKVWSRGPLSLPRRHKVRGRPNLVPRAFLGQGDGRREKTLASADHVISKHPEKLGVII